MVDTHGAGYYNIRLLPTIYDIMMIVTEFGKFKYKFLPVGMSDSGDVFQAKVDKIIGDIKGIKTYTNDILVLSKNRFSKHIKQLIIIFSILRAASLKVNAPKCSFWLKDIHYLVYGITRVVINDDNNKYKG